MPSGTWEDIGLTDSEYRDSLVSFSYISGSYSNDKYVCVQGRDYIFFEITDPEQLAFTYKVRRWKLEICMQYSQIC